METAGKLAGFAVCAALVALILRRLRPEAGWGVSLGAGAIVLLAALPALSALVLRIRLQPRQGGDEVAVTPSLGPARATALSPNVGVPEGGVFGT